MGHLKLTLSGQVKDDSQKETATVKTTNNKKLLRLKTGKGRREGRTIKSQGVRV